ncbi:MAG: hypothetical protein R2777_06050 [Chitinophagales bacterium]
MIKQKNRASFNMLKDSLDNEKKIGFNGGTKEKYETDILKQEKEQAQLNEQYATQLADKNKKFFYCFTYRCYCYFAGVFVSYLSSTA